MQPPPSAPPRHSHPPSPVHLAALFWQLTFPPVSPREAAAGAALCNYWAVVRSHFRSKGYQASGMRMWVKCKISRQLSLFLVLSGVARGCAADRRGAVQLLLENVTDPR